MSQRKTMDVSLDCLISGLEKSCSKLQQVKKQLNGLPLVSSPRIMRELKEELCDFKKYKVEVLHLAFSTLNRLLTDEINK